MRIRYIPNHITRLSEILSLDYPMSLVMRNIRANLHTPYILSCRAAMQCTVCGHTAKVDVHHKKPVWAHALGQTLRHELRTSHDIRRVVVMFSDGQFDVTGCNDSSNLMSLCHTCHIDADKAAYAHWRAHYMERYPVVFGVRSMERVRLLMSRGTP